ncbi:MAG: Aspartokinase LysC [Candidatus Methanohalarchaeum thermophilum]|uniref:Aspartokinase n=1 Tax=Methanohalarchaeum thermophilum TaxID=1903181 RepID=A0A1Q6DUC8_METT1|nr:MAG: Aspartokinase LysC [Candidatus Methanohalarchaeum thermophilum]
MKFGGTSLADTEMIKRAAEIVREKHNEGFNIAVIASASGKTTDELIKIAKNIESGERKESIKILDEIKSKHDDIVKELIDKDKVKKEVLNEIKDRYKELKTGISELNKVDERFLDYIMSFGEKLSAPILSGALRDLELDSIYLTGREAGILTDTDYGNANPLKETEKKIRNKLEPIIAKSIPVITGFIGGSKNGDTTTLGRGGSDYTASIIGEAIKANEIIIWTDVDGVLTCDPNIEPNATILDKISYKEAMELSYFGADVLHPKSIAPAIENNIPVKVKNTKKPKKHGTEIIKEEEKVEGVVKGISAEKDVALVNVSGIGMIGTPGVAAEAFTALANEKINIIMISTGSSEPTISILVDKNDLSNSIRALRNHFEGGAIEEVTRDSDVAVVSVVGTGMAGTPGVAGRVFEALGKREINIKMISQGSSEFNISFVIKENDVEKAIRILHKEFGLDKVKEKLSR